MDPSRSESDSDSNKSFANIPGVMGFRWTQQVCPINIDVPVAYVEPPHHRYQGNRDLWGYPQGEGRLYLSDSGDTYVGNFKDGKFDGDGTMTYANRDKYEGKWVDNQIHGEGNMKYVDGSTYVGNFHSGTWHGEGEFTHINGDAYKGNFNNGVSCGYGVYTWCQNTDETPRFYQGNFKNNMAHGLGKKYLGKKEYFYDGSWKKDKYDGKGTIQFNEEKTKIFLGEWKDGKIINGTMILIDKDGYKTTFYSDKWNDTLTNSTSISGLITYHNKFKYKGPWINMKRNGKGILYYPNTSIYYRGLWLEDKQFDDNGKINYQSGDVYIGSIRDDLKHGLGKYTHKKNGSVFEGFFEFDVAKGNGKLVYPDGSEYEGEFSNDSPNGKGLKRLRNGSEIIGLWLDGELVEEVSPSSSNKVRKITSDDTTESAVNSGIEPVLESPLKDTHAQDEGRDLLKIFKVSKTPSGSIMKGNWIDKIPIEKHTITYLDGSNYIGEIKFNDISKEPILHGLGVLKKKEYIYEGTWENGDKIGEGRCIFSDGTILVGKIGF